METILSEDWADFEEEYPFRMDFFDKEGKPGMSQVTNKIILNLKNFITFTPRKLKLELVNLAIGTYVERK